MTTEARKVRGSAGNRGQGRKKGVPNKVTGAVKDMILQALANKGGVKYLEEQADANPVAFMTLVGKVIPLQIQGTGAEGAPITITLNRQPEAPDAG